MALAIITAWISLLKELIIEVDTEVTLVRGNLKGRIDVLRKVESGYIIQEEKFKDPPKEERVFSPDKLQVDAYAYLAEVGPSDPTSNPTHIRRHN